MHTHVNKTAIVFGRQGGNVTRDSCQRLQVVAKLLNRSPDVRIKAESTVRAVNRCSVEGDACQHCAHGATPDIGITAQPTKVELCVRNPVDLVLQSTPVISEYWPCEHDQNGSGHDCPAGVGYAGDGIASNDRRQAYDRFQARRDYWHTNKPDQS
jgi:hypothetical protein